MKKDSEGELQDRKSEIEIKTKMEVEIKIIVEIEIDMEMELEIEAGVELDIVEMEMLLCLSRQIIRNIFVCFSIITSHAYLSVLLISVLFSLSLSLSLSHFIHISLPHFNFLALSILAVHLYLLPFFPTSCFLKYYPSPPPIPPQAVDVNCLSAAEGDFLSEVYNALKDLELEIEIQIEAQAQAHIKLHKDTEGKEKEIEKITGEEKRQHADQVQYNII